MDRKIINTPITKEDARSLKMGDTVYITGTIYTSRDAGHKRMVEMLDKGEELPINLDGQVVYYAGPCPNKPGQVIGSVGPTTSGRMDAYSPRMLDEGLLYMIGKGKRDAGVKEAIKRNKGIYFIAVGGAGALISQCVKSAEIIAFEDLGTEALRKLEVVDFPVIVGIDTDGNDIYDQNK